MLFEPMSLGRLTLRNRVVMAPMTRCRAIGNVANGLMAAYYRSRADAGLLITEGTAPSADGLGYARIPGLYTAEQAASWRQVTDAVHAEGGVIFVQLMHTGRVGAAQNLPAGGVIRGPSAIAAPGQMWTDSDGMVPHPVPEAMDEATIEAALEGFAHASRLAMDAGFDGVELHGANGYLIEQFLNVASNQRSDRWGGSVENRARFAVEAARRAAAAIGAERIAMRLSPYGASVGMVADADTDALYAHLATELGKLGLAYLHVVDHSAMGAPAVPAAIKATIRRNFGGTIIACGGFDAARAEAALQANEADLTAFGRPFLGNPDLLTKLKSGAELAGFDFSKAYAAGADGYTEL